VRRELILGRTQNSVLRKESSNAQNSYGWTHGCGVTTAEIKTIATGWSAKQQLLEKNVYNDQNEKVGEIEDIIVAPDKSVTYAIVGVGGFLGLGEHYVAIPFTQLKAGDNKFVLAGATKEKLKALPKFEYAT
jgi:sporulation protein YlmC with PRC-barrel domain